MYDELYAAWRLETEQGELSSLSSDFYRRLSEYLYSVQEASQPDEAQSVRKTLLNREAANAVRMARELIAVRYHKLLKFIAVGRKVPQDRLAAEEQKLYLGVLPAADAYSKFAKNLLEGHLVDVNVPAASVEAAAEPAAAPRRVMVRFLKPVPSIMGSDMKSYGPFLVEDVASVPAENAKILVKQGLARAVEPS